jgi:Zn-dependent peptidase ImmA (M78 family)
MDKAAIEKEARRVQYEIWSQRSLLYPLGEPPLRSMFEPRRVADYYGLEYDEREHMAAEHGHVRGFEAAGVLDRRRGILAVSTRFPYVTQRFTAAHELGHFVLHPWIGDQVVHRDRPLNGPTNGRPIHEQEADHFAACLLMPRKLVEEAFDARYGTKRPLALTEAVAFHLGVRDASPLFSAPRGSLLFAAAVARADKFDTKRFPSLADHFGVSNSAMAIRLHELDLVVDYLAS